MAEPSRALIYMDINKLAFIKLSDLIKTVVIFSFLSTTVLHADETINCDISSCNDIADQFLATNEIDNAAIAYTKGCELNDSASCYNIATIYAEGYAGEADFSKAVPFYKKSCELKDSDACTDLADEYDGLDDYANARTYYSAACALDDGYGCRLLASTLDQNIKPRDLKQVTALYAKGCELEDGWSCNNLGYDYMGYDDEPNPYAPTDYAKGIQLMTLACDTYGKGTACATLSSAYTNGHGVKKNLSESMRYNIKSCEGSEVNYGGGCFNVGVDLDNGNGVKKDPEKAHHYYEKGCELDDSNACLSAGINHEYGDGAEKDHEKSQYFYRYACELDNEDACEYLND